MDDAQIHSATSTMVEPRKDKEEGVNGGQLSLCVELSATVYEMIKIRIEGIALVTRDHVQIDIRHS